MNDRIDPKEYMEWKTETHRDEGRYSTATVVNAERSNGQIEPGWTVAAKSSDGKVTIIKEGTGEMKRTTVEELDRFNKFPGDVISVKRTSGEIEDNWTLVGTDKEGRIVVEKRDSGKKSTKHISQEDFIELNYDLETDENSHT